MGMCEIADYRHAKHDRMIAPTTSMARVEQSPRDTRALSQKLRVESLAKARYEFSGRGHVDPTGPINVFRAPKSHQRSEPISRRARESS